MITIIFGLPKIGKTALNTYFAIQHMTKLSDGEVLFTRSKCEQLNEGGFNVSIPEKHVVYSDINIKYSSSDYLPRTSFDIDGYKFGVPNDKFETTFVPPGAKLFFTEGQRYWNSHKDLPEAVTRAFENHGHYFLDIFIDVQRPGLINLNIRELTSRFIEVLEQKDILDKNGDPVQTTWKCKQFSSCYEVTKYQSDGRPPNMGENISFTFYGNIRECYNAFENYAAFLKGRENEDFSTASHKNYNITVDEINSYNAAHSLLTPQAIKEG